MFLAEDAISFSSRRGRSSSADSRCWAWPSRHLEVIENPRDSASMPRQSFCNGRDAVMLLHHEAISMTQPPIVAILKRKIREAAFIGNEGFRKADVSQDRVDLLSVITDFVLRRDLYSCFPCSFTDPCSGHFIYGLFLHESIPRQAGLPERAGPPTWVDDSRSSRRALRFSGGTHSGPSAATGCWAACGRCHSCARLRS